MVWPEDGLLALMGRPDITPGKFQAAHTGYAVVTTFAESLEADMVEGLVGLTRGLRHRA